MTGRKNEPRDELARLTESLVEDILETSDDEVLAEAAEDFDDVDAVVDHAKELIEGAIVEAGKRRMRRAKEAVGDRHQRGEPNVIHLPDEKKREILRRLAAQQPQSIEKITQAARKEGELTGNDLDAMLEALFQLGAIDDQGNPK